MANTFTKKTGGCQMQYPEDGGHIFSELFTMGLRHGEGGFTE